MASDSLAWPVNANLSESISATQIGRSHKHVMAFRLHKKSDLIAGAIVFSFIGGIFVLAAVFGDSIGSHMHIVINGVVLQKSDPDYSHKLLMWRIGMIIASALLFALAWLCYRGSRRIAD